jgi:SAM-dependent methyltransferase
MSTVSLSTSQARPAVSSDVASSRRPYTYLLGDSGTEAQRLRAQAHLWDPTAHALFDRLKIRRGMRVLEIGPGAGSLHRELRRRVRGPVDAVEPSETFARGIERLATRDGFGRGELWRANLSTVRLTRARYDVIFARWVFLFLPDPAAHVRQLTRALRPGGVLAVEDYQRETLRMIPPPEAWERFLAADRAFFETQGGHASIGARLPSLFAQAGLDVVDITPTVRSGRPGSPVWNWLSAYFLGGVIDRFVGLAGFTAADARALKRDWIAASKEPASLLMGPALIDVVGRKPRRAV